MQREVMGGAFNFTRRSNALICSCIFVAITLISSDNIKCPFELIQKAFYFFISRHHTLVDKLK